ncbi:MAG TPA: TetR/AcrR family transcriptional regulator [Ktedonobacterales bacterium]|nr:TetR/AcrR family transcriptional regulator [Ktedonobacterales bacterium]
MTENNQAPTSVTPDSPGDATIATRRRPGRPTSDAPIADVETRTLILAAARRLFMQRGFAAVAVGEVASAAGVTKPTLYYHFGDKEGLYADVLCDLMRVVGGYIRSVTESDASARTRLDDLAAGYFQYADATMEPMMRDATELLGESHAQRVHETYAREMLAPIAHLMEDGMRHGELAEGNADFLVRAWFGLLDAFTAQGGHSARTPDEHRQMAIQVVRFFLDGAAPR